MKEFYCSICKEIFVDNMAGGDTAEHYECGNTAELVRELK
jgi:hypothetical protein